MRPSERYTRKARRAEDQQPTPLAGKIILFIAGFVTAGMIGVLATCGA